MSGEINPALVKPPLSQEQLKFYWDNGYLIIRKLFDIPTIRLFGDRFIQICNDPSARRFYSLIKDPSLFKENQKPENYINKIQELLYDEVYMKYTEDPHMLRVVSQIIGEDISAVNCMLINKPPGTQPHPPHQDLYWFPFRPADRIVASWTAVDPVYPDNGGLYVLPGSHKVETLYVHAEEINDRKQFYHTILKSDVVAAEHKRLYLTMEPGDTVFFHPYLVHGSGPNVTQHYRKCVTAHFANSSCHYINVTGTPQEVLANIMEKEIRRRGGEFDFVDLWKMKRKHIRGVRSNL